MGRTRNFFSDIWRSASDLRFYQEVAVLPIGVVCRHFLMVTGVFGTILSVLVVVQLVFMNNLWLWCRDNLPPVTIRDGEAHAEVAQPYMIERKMGDKANFAVIIDTTGKTETVDPRYSAGVLISRKAVTFKVGDMSLERDLSGVKNLSIDKGYFNGRVVGYGKIALYVVGIYGALLVLLSAQAAGAALIGKGVALLRRSRCSYMAIFRMSLYALSLAVCVLFLVLFLGIGLNVRYILALYVFIHFAFLIGAVLTSRGDESAA